MFANHYKLDNLCIMIDVNGLQIDGATRDVMNSEPLDHKMDAFGFNTIVCNGNSFSDLEQASRCLTCPTAAASPPASCCAPPRVWASATWKTPRLARQGPQRRRIRPGYDRAARRPRHAGKGDRVQQWLILKKIATRVSYGNTLVELAQQALTIWWFLTPIWPLPPKPKSSARSTRIVTLTAALPSRTWSASPPVWPRWAMFLRVQLCHVRCGPRL